MSFKGRECDPRGDAERLSVTDAFSRYAGVDLLAALSDRGEGNREVLAKEAERADFSQRPNGFLDRGPVGIATLAPMRMNGLQLVANLRQGGEDLRDRFMFD